MKNLIILISSKVYRKVFRDQVIIFEDDWDVDFEFCKWMQLVIKKHSDSEWWVLSKHCLPSLKLGVLRVGHVKSRGKTM